jgi:uncharacterized membrane protein
MKRRTNPSKKPSPPVSKRNSPLPESRELVRSTVREMLESGAFNPVIQSSMTRVQLTGPLPVASETAKYEEIMPGFTDRWTKMSEKEQQNQFDTTKRRDKYEITHKLTSLLLAFVLGMTLIGGGIWLLSKGMKIEGYTAIGLAAASVLAAKLRKGPRAS